MIGIVDYGAGNLLSVRKAFDYLGMPNRVLQKSQELKAVKKLVLPGVGSFGHAMHKIMEKQWLDPIKDWLYADRPFLGICLGMQLLFEASEETENIAGLEFFKGTCLRFEKGKVPQTGWNAIHIDRDTSLLEGINSGEYFYFVHSYYVCPQGSEVNVAHTTYGLDFTSIAGEGRIFGVQFHPEKSGEAGLKLLSNWGIKC
jgi:imidazole glycerol phosphate synthase glutamine amidotransferase subunit